jgi:hypothetical protein
MKKIILGTVLVVALGFAFGTHAARAADVEALTPTEATLVKQSLDAVNAFVGQLEARVEANDPAILNAAPQVSAVLASVSANLESIRSTLATLDANAKAIAQNAGPASTPTQVVAETTPVETVSPVTEVLPASPAPTNPEIAVVATHFNVRNLIWPSVAVLVIFGAVWSLRARKTQDDKETIELGSLDHAWDPIV